MCRSLKVSRSGYYEWRSRPPSDRTQANTALTEHVRRVYAEHKGRAGAPRITKQLRQEGQPVGKNRVARLMRTEQLRAKAARKYKATTTSNHSLPVAPNLLEQDFSADAPNRKWVSESPMWRPMKVGCTWLWCSICTLASWWAGRCQSA